MILILKEQFYFVITLGPFSYPLTVGFGGVSFDLGLLADGWLVIGLVRIAGLMKIF